MEDKSPNLNNNDLNIFKEEILTHLRELETKITAQITSKESKLNNDYVDFTDKMNSLIDNNKNVVSDLVSQKIKIEKISELEAFKNKVDSMVITHEVRIKNAIDEIEKIKTKYDKIVSDNLYVSGFIGNSCQFRNLSEYLSYNISEVSKMKLERDQFKRELKDLKSKLDGLMKTVITLNDNSVKLCNKYTDNKQEEFQKLLQVHEQELNQKNLQMRTLVVQFQSDNEKNTKSLKEEFNKLLEMKNEFNNLINEKYETFEQKHDELYKKVINNSLNIETNTDKTEKLNEEIKVVDKNVKDLAFQVRNFYCVNNRLAELLEKLGANPSKSEIAKLILGTVNNRTNEKTKTISVSPQPKRRKNNMNMDLFKNALDDIQIVKNIDYNTNDKMINVNISPKKNYNIIGLKKMNDDDNNFDSDNSSIIETDIKNNKNNNIKLSSKQLYKNDIKPILTENNITKVNNKNNLENNNFKKANNAIKDKNKKEDNMINIDNLRDKIKESSITEKISSTSRTIISASKQVDVNNENTNRSNKVKFPILTLGGREENTLEEIKVANLSSSIIRYNSESNQNKNDIIMVINNENSSKQNNKKNMMKKADLELEQDKQACKIVSLKLPETTLVEPVYNIIKKKKENQRKKYDVVNSLINDYRAKLFSKVHSPDAKIDLTNEILDIPKKVTQAFGRTTYTFYFKKDAIDCANANKNINNFGYKGSKRRYKFQNNKKNDIGSYVSIK
jgi:hypothetical protein